MFIAKIKHLPKEMKPVEVRTVTPIIEEICVRASSADIVVISAVEETKINNKNEKNEKNEMQKKISELSMHQNEPIVFSSTFHPKQEAIKEEEEEEMEKSTLNIDDDLDEFLSPEKTKIMDDEEEEEEDNFVSNKLLSSSKKKLNETFSYHSPTYDEWNPFQSSHVDRLKNELNSILNPFGNNNDLVEKMFSNASLSSLFQELNSQENLAVNYKYAGPLVSIFSKFLFFLIINMKFFPSSYVGLLVNWFKKTHHPLCFLLVFCIPLDCWNLLWK